MPTKYQLHSTKVQLLFMIVFILLRFSPEEYKPNSLTNFVTPQDISLINWMENNLPQSSIVYIPAMTYGKDWGLDAGIWVEPLTGISTIRIPAFLNKSPQELINKKCIKTNSNQYIYIGTTENSFDVSNFDLLKLKKSFKDAALYQFICE